MSAHESSWSQVAAATESPSICTPELDTYPFLRLYAPKTMLASTAKAT